MRFSVVGNLSDAVLLLSAIEASADDGIACACATESLAHEITARSIHAPIVNSTEEAIQVRNVDTVIVATRCVEDSINLVRRASQEDLHVVVFLPDEVSTAYSYELHLLLDESKRGIIVVSGRWFCDYSVLPATTTSSIRKLELSLPIAESKDCQRMHQLHAIDAMCGAGYRFTQITGLDIPGGESDLQSRTITLASSPGAELVMPPATIHFVRDEPAACNIHATSEDGTVHSVSTALPSPSTIDSWQNASKLIGRLKDSLIDPPICQSLMEQSSNSLELLEGLDKSLRRRRTVDVYLDSISERAVFKTQMTAIGCGVLAYLSFGMIAYLVVAQVVKPPVAMLQIGRLIWLCPLVIFLFAQFLLPFARKRDSVVPANHAAEETDEQTTRRD